MMIIIQDSENKEKRYVYYAVTKISELDYKNADQLKKFVNDKGKILPRRTTGACSKHQRDITTAVKKSKTHSNTTLCTKLILLL